MNDLNRFVEDLRTKTVYTLTAKMFGAKIFGENNFGEQMFGGFFIKSPKIFGK